MTVHRDTGSTYSIGQTFRQNEMIHTAKGEFIQLFTGTGTEVNLDENTNLQLKSLSKNNIRVGFGHGRILVYVNENDGGNLEVDTPTAQNNVIGRVSFIGYDFKKETSVIPMFFADMGSIHTTIPLTNQSFATTTPITIHDVNPPTINQITFDEKTDTRKEFYLWSEQK